MENVSSKMITKLVEWRETRSPERWKRVGKVIATEIALPLLALVAIVETVVYSLLLLVSLPLYPLTKRPLKFFASLSKDSALTILYASGYMFINLIKQSRVPTNYSYRSDRSYYNSAYVNQQRGDGSDDEIRVAEINSTQDFYQPTQYQTDSVITHHLKNILIGSYHLFGDEDKESIETFSAGAMNWMFAKLVLLDVVLKRLDVAINELALDGDAQQAFEKIIKTPTSLTEYRIEDLISALDTTTTPDALPLSLEQKQKVEGTIRTIRAVIEASGTGTTIGWMLVKSVASGVMLNRSTNDPDTPSYMKDFQEYESHLCSVLKISSDEITHSEQTQIAAGELALDMDAQQVFEKIIKTPTSLTEYTIGNPLPTLDTTATPNALPLSPEQQQKVEGAIRTIRAIMNAEGLGGGKLMACILQAMQSFLSESDTSVVAI